jgi:hypothetical protein
MEMVCCQSMAQSSAWNSTYDDLPGLQQQQKHGCQREKAAKQWHRPDASVKGRKEAMRAE